MSKTRHRPQGSQQKAAQNVTGGQVRIIAGRWRGRRLTFPAVNNLRPTGDRIRETLFNWLQPVIDGSICLDLFAGSGALGFEASSRGAAHVTLIESHAEAVAALKQHRRALGDKPPEEGLAGELHIVHEQALNWLLRQRGGQSFDIVFLDPPFAMPGVAELTSTLESSGLLSEKCWIYLESAAGRVPPGLPGNWHIHREKSAGEVCYRLYQRG